MRLLGRVYCDTNIIIYLTEGNPDFIKQSKILTKYIENSEILSISSEISVLELLTGLYKQKQNFQSEPYLSFIREAIISEFHPVSLPILKEAARIRSQSRLKSMDAIHLASAHISNCDIFLTNDRAFQSDKIDVAFFDELIP